MDQATQTMISNLQKNIETLPSFELIGIKLPNKTWNRGGKSSVDAGNLWQRFHDAGVFHQIPSKLSEEVYAVYFDYDGDQDDPFSYFIGCKVSPNAFLPEGLDRLIIPSQTYQKLIAKGPMPDCISGLWKEIWQSEISRAFIVDFEIYGEKSKNWESAEVDVYLSINP
ncbi:MAG: GyrI-like domain-containing protein [Bacteroidota bacterium]